MRRQRRAPTTAGPPPQANAPPSACSPGRSFTCPASPADNDWIGIAAHSQTGKDPHPTLRDLTEVVLTNRNRVLREQQHQRDIAERILMRSIQDCDGFTPSPDSIDHPHDEVQTVALCVSLVFR